MATHGESPIVIKTSRSIAFGVLALTELVAQAEPKIAQDTRLYLILGPDTNANGLRDDLEPMLATRYGRDPKLRDAAANVLVTLRQALVPTSSAEVTLDAASKLARAMDCVLDRFGDEEGARVNRHLRAQTVNSAVRSSAWHTRNQLLSGQQVSPGPGDPCVAID